MYEALLREGMDAESMDKFDRALDEASDLRPRTPEDRAAKVRAAGGQVN